MKRVDLSFPEFGLIVATRAALGAGVGLLLAVASAAGGAGIGSTLVRSGP